MHITNQTRDTKHETIALSGVWQKKFNTHQLRVPFRNAWVKMSVQQQGKEDDVGPSSPPHLSALTIYTGLGKPDYLLRRLNP